MYLTFFIMIVYIKKIFFKKSVLALQLEKKVL